MTNTPAPGWYEDPYDATRVRWWDGTAWAEETHPNPNNTPTSTPEPEYIAEPEPESFTSTEFVQSPDEFVPPSNYTSGVETYEEIRTATVSQNNDVTEEDSPVLVSPLRSFGSIEDEVVLVSTDPSEFRSDSAGVKLATNRWKKKALKTIGIVSILAIVGIVASWVLYFRLDFN